MAASALHLTHPLPVQIDFGAGLHEQVEPPQEFVVLADPSAVTQDMRLRWLQRWGERCLGWVWQDQRMSSLDAAQSLASQIWPSLAGRSQRVLWVIGGGTTLDLGKMLRWVMPQTSEAVQAWRDNCIVQGATRHPLWCSPTTSGTGSEVTPWATVWDLQASPACKRSWYPPDGHPDRALVDSQLSLSCPLAVTRDCALDALSHALESIWNRSASPTSRPLAQEAARLVLTHLPALLQRPDDAALRERLSYASLLAGLAMAQTQTALAHALSYDLTLRDNVPHGMACAVWLPMVMDLAMMRDAGVSQELQTLFALPSRQAVESLQSWLEAIGVRCRDLRASPAGSLLLSEALRSQRGRNFVGV